jgi:2-polyprenyl-3-methyl-5-hydroxy-6-metoxy-1,4-benzoquinol methylase
MGLQKFDEENEVYLFKHKGFSFYENDFIPYLEKCPICGSSDREIISHVKKIFHYYKCNNCYAVSSSHYLKNDILEKFYLSYYKRNPGYNEVGIIHDSPILFAKHICSYLEIYDKNIDLLDYGGGNGLISYNIALKLLETGSAQNVNILVVDFNEEAIINNTDPRITIAKLTPDKFILGGGGGRYDLIIASSILEHIFFAGDLMKILFGSLKTYGYFYVRSPYIMPLYNLLLKFRIEINIWFPEHNHDFSKSFFENITQTFGLNDIKLIISQPAFFERSLKKTFFPALASRIIRFPYYLNKNYPFVGSWEIIYRNYK